MSVKIEMKDWACQTSFLEVYQDFKTDFSQFPDHSLMDVIQVKMDEAATKTLVFYVNGRKVIDSNPDPGETLLTYLRNKLRLASTYTCTCTFLICNVRVTTTRYLECQIYQQTGPHL